MKPIRIAVDNTKGYWTATATGSHVLGVGGTMVAAKDSRQEAVESLVWNLRALVRWYRHQGRKG